MKKIKIYTLYAENPKIYLENLNYPVNAYTYNKDISR